MNDRESLIPRHGGYRKLKSFQVAQLVYDVTVRFCDKYIEKRSRTHDQMIQAARSGVQNIAEGSQAAGTSKKTELKLTNVARASLEELRLDYEDFLRQRKMPLWSREDVRRQSLINQRCVNADCVAKWVAAQRVMNERSVRTGKIGKPDSSQSSAVHVDATFKAPSTTSTTSTESTYPEIAANAVLVLITVAASLLDRQITSLAEAFEREGGFTERLYRVRKRARGAGS